jgi:hypothetical protein
VTGNHHSTDPSGTASVVLDVGGATGAIAVYTGPERCGQEIEVSLAGAAEPVRTHAAVRAREVRPRTLYAALIAELPAGRYVVWRDRDTPLETVTVIGGAVTECEWPG